MGNIAPVVQSTVAQEQDSSKFMVQTDRMVYPWGGQEFSVGLTISIAEEIPIEGAFPNVEVYKPDGTILNVTSELAGISTKDGYQHLSYLFQLPSSTPAGVYRVIATYSDRYQSEVDFTVESALVPECEVSYCTVQLQINNITYPVHFETVPVPVSIRNITEEIDRNAIVLDLSAFANGILYVALPRDLIDAVEVDSVDNAIDVRFTVLVDGEDGLVITPLSLREEEELYASVLKLSEGAEKYRFVGIRVDEDSRRVEIIGTQIAPEFSSSSLIAVVMIASIVATFVWSRWGRIQWGR